MCQLTTFLDPALSENARADWQVPRRHLVMVWLARHLELSQGTLGEFLFDLFLKVDEFSFYFGIDVPLAFQWAAC